MKKTKIRIAIASVALFFFMGGITVNAQKAEIGFRFMPTISSFNMQTSSGGVVKGEAVLGYGVGGFVGFNFSDHVGIQVEAIYSSITQKYVEADREHKVKLNYFNIPLLLTLNTGKSKAVNFSIVGGPQLGLSAGSSIKSSGGDGTSTTQAVLSVKKGDIGLAYGAGLDFGLNAAHSVRLGLGFRGVLGLIDISDNSGTKAADSYYILDRTKIKTYSGYVGLSFLF